MEEIETSRVIEDSKKCPNCENWIDDEYTQCPMCGNLIGQ